MSDLDNAILKARDEAGARFADLTKARAKLARVRLESSRAVAEASVRRAEALYWEAANVRDELVVRRNLGLGLKQERTK